MLAELTADHSKLSNRVRFVKEIIEGQLIVQNRKKALILVDLKSRGYDPVHKPGAQADEDGEVAGGYDYLLSMPIWNLTMEKVYFVLFILG